MSSDDEQGLGDLFAAGEEAPPTYPVEELCIHRIQLRHEGVTNAGFIPLLQRLDRASPDDRGDIALAPLTVYYRNKRHSLWGHKLWNAAKYMVKRMDSHMIDVRGKTVLELGAGLGVPSLVAYRNGARCVVVTDYPDSDLIDILEMNVRANCAPDMLDADAVDFLLQEARERKVACASSQGGASNNCGEVELTDVERQRATSTRCVVEPLLWGKDSHIRQVMSYTGGSGFDIVLLSDILFNHVCNDDLADTVARVLQRGPHAAAYCVFSHHRAYKQVEDLEFFDKCVARGLRYEQVDEENYPLMFPEDRGPAEVRQPVKVYKIVHYFDDAGAAFEPGHDVFDVVIQGTGQVESLLSAALARSGIRVLHCDGQEDYGGAFKTLSVVQMREYIAATAITARRTKAQVLEKDSGACDETHNENDAFISLDVMDTLDLRKQRRFLLDLLPMHYLSSGETVQQLMGSHMARHLEFQRFASFTFLLPVDGSSRSGFRLQSVPLTRGQVFADGHMGLMQKRRLMKFVKDVEASLAEQLHARTADAGDDPLSQAALTQARAVAEQAGRLFAEEARANPGETLSAMLERKYGVTGDALDSVTLMQQLNTTPNDALRSVELVRQVLTSVGAFGGSTPFLQSMYGTSEVPQNMCRIAAVWDATFVLRRSLRRVVPGAAAPSAELSNHQRIKAKVAVVPRVLAGCFAAPRKTEEEEEEEEAVRGEVQFSRVIMVAKAPLVSWGALRAAGCCEAAAEETGTERDAMEAFPPLVLALCHARPGVVVHVQQTSAAAEQAPDDGASVVVHFTVDNSRMGAGELHRFVKESFVRDATADSTTPPTGSSLTVDASQILFLAAFVLGEREEAQRSLLNPVTAGGVNDADLSETRKAHPYAVEEYRKRQQRQQQQQCEGDLGDSEEACQVVSVPTLFENLIDDGAYVQAAKKAYDSVVAKLQLREEDGKQYTFLECLPPLPGEGS